MNKEKLAKLEAGVRIGGPGSARRKRKIIRKSSTTDDKKLQNSLKKLAVNNISGIEEVNMIKEDGTVIHFNNPKVQASLNANTFAISGHGEHKQVTEMLPQILSHMGNEGFGQLNKVPASAAAAAVNQVKLDEINVARGAVADEDVEIPTLVDDFETASKKDPAPSGEKKKGESDNKENKPEQSKKSKKKKKKANAAAAAEASEKAKDGGEADDEGEDGKEA